MSAQRIIEPSPGYTHWIFLPVCTTLSIYRLLSSRLHWVTQLLTNWSYRSLALNHGYNPQAASRDAYLMCGWVQCILDVTLSHDTQMADDFDGSGTQHVVLEIRESLWGGYHDRLASVNAQRVHILHVTNLQGKNSGNGSNRFLHFST